jgi:hypothetical protein
LLRLADQYYDMYLDLYGELAKSFQWLPEMRSYIYIYISPARDPKQWFCSPSGVLDGQLAWGAIWKWFSIVNIDVWARDHSFRLDETTASVTMQVLFSFWSNICLCVIYVYIPNTYQIRMCWQPVLRIKHFALYSEKLQASLDL